MRTGPPAWAEPYLGPVVGAVVAVGVVFCVEAAALVTGLLSGAPGVVLLGPGDLFDVVGRLVGVAPRPGSTTAYLSAHAGLFQVCLVGAVVHLLVGLVAVVGGVGRARRSRRARRERVMARPSTMRAALSRVVPVAAGHASHAQIRDELSVTACRESAVRTRPGLSRDDIRSAAPGELGIPLPYTAAGQLWAPFLNPTGTIAPTQSGKSRRWLCQICIDAPGAVLCSTTKPDLLELSALSRSRRSSAGPVLVFDLTGTTRWPARLRWSPLHGCRDQQQAWATAKRLVNAAAAGIEAGGGRGAGNDRVFRQRAIGVVGAYLLAAAHAPTTSDNTNSNTSAGGNGGGGLGRVAVWAADRAAAREAVTILTSHPAYRSLGAALAAELGMVAETADAVWLSVRRALEPFSDPRIQAMCDIDPDTSYDVEQFIDAGGALYLIAEEDDAAAVPILTTIVDEWIAAARALALTYPGRRLDPPATVVLDELPAATPVPSLPTSQADSAGRGVIIHWAAQSRSQLDTVYGDRARALLENSTVFSVWGGIKDDDTLSWLSTIIGERDRTRHTHPTSGVLSTERAGSHTTERVPVYSPAAIRTLPRGEVLVIYRHLPVIRATTIDAYQRADADQLRADVAAIETGDIPIDRHGYRTHPGDPPAKKPGARGPGVGCPVPGSGGPCLRCCCPVHRPTHPAAPPLSRPAGQRVGETSVSVCRR